MRKNLIDGMDAVVARVARRDSQDLLIVFLAIDHVQQTDWPRLHHASGEAWLIDQNHNVQRIAVVGQGARDETVIAGVVHG